MEFHYTTYRSPVGEIHLLTSSKGLRALEMNRTYPEFYLGNSRRSGGEWIKVKPEAHPVLKQAVRALEEYFEEGHPLSADIPLDLQGTPFQLQVWKTLRKIPFGKTNSYGQVAAKIGRPKSPRAVGAACGSNPVSLFVPCHRVVASDGGLCGFGGGLDVKQQLLEHEGLTF
jgi:methylated-DNA-[protein]-cysteine S-methyltransferase